jgi:cysteine desulfurase
MDRIYLDHNATTPVDPAVLEAMLPYLRDVFGNASSVHEPGRAAREAVEQARAQVARLIGAEPREIVFTSGGTEADNQAVRGVLELARTPEGRPGHVITSAIEHPAVLNTCQHVAKRGHPVTYLPVDVTGRVKLEELAPALTPETVLVSVMLANNEIGTIQPVPEIARLAHEKGVTVHTDAVQALGRIPVDVGDLGVDLLTISAHKVYGPKGTGALCVRRGTRIAPLIHGGHHESRRRAGTENVPGIVGFGRACEIAGQRLAEVAAREARLRDRLQQGILARVPHAQVNGHLTERLPNTLNVGFTFVEGEALLMNLDLEGIAVSTGSACSSGDLKPSHVLLALGLDHASAHGTLRFSLGRANTEAEIDATIDAVARVVERVRAMSPMYHDFKKRQQAGAASPA